MGDPGRFSVFLYEDGRLIWQRLGGGEDDNAIGYTTGFLEQRLSPQGVELVKAEVLSTGLFDRDLRLGSGQGLNFGQIDVHEGDRTLRVTWGDCCRSGSEAQAKEMPTPEQASALRRLDARLADPASWLPANAWENPGITAYVPSGYSVSLIPDEEEERVGLARALASLPLPAEDLIRTLDITRDEYTNLLGPHVYWHTDVTTEKARALARILDDADQALSEDVFGLRYGFGQRHPDATHVTLSIGPLLPHQT
jgi:hypothetical protein